MSFTVRVILFKMLRDKKSPLEVVYYLCKDNAHLDSGPYIAHSYIRENNKVIRFIYDHIAE